MNETAILKKIQLALSQGDARLFRNNVGEAWQGMVQNIGAHRILIDRPRLVHFGLAPGSGDLIGWRTILVTPQMVGYPFAQFVSLEVKSRRGVLADHQRAWAQRLRQSGGLAETVRTIEAAVELLGSV